MKLNYTSILSTTAATSETLSYFNIGTSYSTVVPTGVKIFWLRNRSYPPNATMPVSTLGAVENQPPLSMETLLGAHIFSLHHK